MTTLRLGTRGSKLALAQAGLVADRLRAAHAGLEIALVEVTTAGDRDQTSALAEGVGWFTTALQEAIRQGEVDFAVHSYKDLPTRRPDGLVLAAVPLRDDPRDALVSRQGHTLRRLPAGSVVGTSSPRREAQLRALRPDLEVRPIRGNVDSRLAKVDAGQYEATVLALAGLRRLGCEERATEVFGVHDFLPAPAQGALAVECRSDDGRTRALLEAVDDPLVRQAVTAERSFLAALGAGCSFPAAAYAEHFGTTLKLHALLAPEGRLFRSRTGGPADAASALGRALAEELMALADMHP